MVVLKKQRSLTKTQVLARACDLLAKGFLEEDMGQALQSRYGLTYQDLHDCVVDPKTDAWLVENV